MSEFSGMIGLLDMDDQNRLYHYFAGAPESLKEKFRAFRVPAGTTFITEGTAADTVYFLLKGQVSAVDYRVKGSAYGFFRFLPPERFGTMEILGRMEHYKTTLAAVKDSVFLKIPRNQFEPWLLGDADALRMEMEHTVGYLLKQSRKERLYVLLPGNERIYLLLIYIYETYARNGVYRFYLSRKEFAEATGLSERTVTRALKELEAEGCITRDGWDVLITREQYQSIRERIKSLVSEWEEN